MRQFTYTEFPEPTALVRPTSHRSRARLEYMLGCTPQSYYSSVTHEHFTKVPLMLLPGALALTGVKPGKCHPDNLRRCWSAM